MAFPWLFPDGKGDPTDPNHDLRHISLKDGANHLTKVGYIDSNGILQYPFASDVQLPYWFFNTDLRHSMISQARVFLKINPDAKDVSVEELLEMVEKQDGTLLQRMVHCGSKVAGTPPYWADMRCRLDQACRQLGCPTILLYSLLCDSSVE